MRWLFSFFFPGIVRQLRCIHLILNPNCPMPAKTSFTTAEATELLVATTEALVKLKSDVAAVTAQLEPLALENESLVSLVDELKSADSEVDRQLGLLAEVLNPTVAPETEPVIEEPVVTEPTE